MRFTHILHSCGCVPASQTRDFSGASRKVLPSGKLVGWLARVPDRASSGVEPLACAAPGPAMNGGLPGFRTPTDLSIPRPPVLLLLFCLLGLPFTLLLCSGFDLSAIRSGSVQTMRQHRGPWSLPQLSSPSPSASAAALSTSACPTRQVALTLTSPQCLCTENYSRSIGNIFTADDTCLLYFRITNLELHGNFLYIRN